MFCDNCQAYLIDETWCEGCQIDFEEYLYDEDLDELEGDENNDC